MCLKILILYLYLYYNSKNAKAANKFVHQTDISEFCKRRVAPSVFLGQRVMDANSHVVQFSRLDVPYTCSLSIRAESGTNIILVVQLQSEENLFEACSMNREQLIVYEFGETFGGYWGLRPDARMHNTVMNYTNFYTLKTTRPPTHRTTRSHKPEELILTQTETQSTVEEKQYYTIDVPIVNVSGNFQLGPQRQTDDSEELFDFIYDVTPRNGMKYETSVMPLVQFSIRPQINKYGGEARYELDYGVKGFTIDPRLKFNTAKRKKTSKRRDWRAKKRYRHRTKSTAMFLTPDTSNYYKKHSSSVPTLDSKYFSKSWQRVDEIIDSINTTTIKSTVFRNESLQDILSIISNTQHNSSVYLAPNMSFYNVEVISIADDKETVLKTAVPNLLQDTMELTTSKLKDQENVKINLESESTETTLSQVSIDTETKIHETGNTITDIIEDASLKAFQDDEENNMKSFHLNRNLPVENETTQTILKIDINNSTKKSLQTGELVDHESWENIVQAAPVMAIVLNKTEPSRNTTETNKTENHDIKKSKKKRHIQSLEVDQSRPKNLTQKPVLVTNTPPLDDVQELARIVELQDDEIGSRVALRYLRHYVGPVLFNLCEYRESNIRQIFLFNSSRIVISVTNFTLKRMNLVLTPALTLASGTCQCSPEQLECQIVGTRVCIDSLNACDGIPNCGSHEIYDEDRLTCGTSHGVQHNVGLAALTFLAVILTVLYITLYWLKRCVPRVSDAFFVYTESSENELFLDSVMRSPNDEDPFNKSAYPGHFFEDDALYRDIHADESKGNFCLKSIKTCLKFLLCRAALTKASREHSTDDGQVKQPTKMFSFTQIELGKIAKLETKYIETAVQTSEIIEMMDLGHKETPKIRKDTFDFPSFSKFRTDSTRPDSELNLIKFSKESRSSYQDDSFSIETAKRKAEKQIGVDGELEIRNTIYDIHLPQHDTKIPVTCEVHADTKGVNESKRLRFDEQLQMIPSVDDSLATTSTVQKLHDEDFDKIEEDEENESFGREFMRFWGAKGKKGKKKKHLPLRL